jgi:NagD protein
MSTDILGASSMGFTTVLTLSSVTQKEDLKHYGYEPDFTIQSLQDLLDKQLFERVLQKDNNKDNNIVYA